MKGDEGEGREEGGMEGGSRERREERVKGREVWWENRRRGTGRKTEDCTRQIGVNNQAG